MMGWCFQTITTDTGDKLMTNSLLPMGMQGGSTGDQVYELEDKCLSCSEQENTAGVNSMTWVIVHRTSEGKNDKFRDCHCGS